MHPFHELFLWAILCNLPDLAFCFWAHGDESLAKALIGKKLFQEMAVIAENEHMMDDIVEQLKNSAK